jgi:hypothetical protein
MVYVGEMAMMVSSTDHRKGFMLRWRQGMAMPASNHPIVRYRWLLVSVLLSLTELTTDTIGAANGTALAYIGKSHGNQEIRQINPDGTNDRLIWRVPPHDKTVARIEIGPQLLCPCAL